MIEYMTMNKREANPFILIVISILAGIGWAIFILIHTIFWSANYDLFQNIIIGLGTLIIVGGFIGLMWVMWAFRIGKK